tara:strand:- start:43 stop:768 length:726 start_codon:yes stop_codon:yes gene_type:complete
MSILDLFGINKEAQPVDVIRSGKELRENIETKNQVLEDLMKENPDLVNNLNQTTQGGLTNLQPKAFTTFNNFINQLTTPRIGNFGILDLVNTGKTVLDPTPFGIATLGIGALKGLGNMFEDRPLGANVVDEFGNVYDFNELNKLNAKGGYYTDPARSARRRTRRIANLLEREKLGKKFSKNILEKLQKQEKEQEDMQRSAIDAMFASGKGGTGQDFTGGRFDGASSRGEYDANPTGFSGSN